MRFVTTKTSPKEIHTKDILEKKTELKTAFKDQNVSLVILYGSVAKDQQKTLSDIDIAVLFKHDNYNLKDVQNVQTGLANVLNREDIDLAILNKASPLLKMQVLKNGKVLYSEHQKDYLLFRRRVIQNYLSTKHLRKQFYQYQKQAVLGRS